LKNLKFELTQGP